VCWNGKPRSDETALGNNLRQATFTLSRGLLWTLWNSRLLWTTGTLQPLARRGEGRCLHTIRRLFTALRRPPVGDVGNRGRSGPMQGRLSKTPEFHRRDLENLSPSQLASSQALQTDFHFCCHNYGDYCLVLYSSFLFPQPSRRRAHPSAIRLASANHHPHSTSAHTNRPFTPNGAQNSEICPVFHPHQCAEGEYNQTRTGARPFRTAALCCRVRPS